MIGDHAECDVDFFLLTFAAAAVCWQCAGVFLAAQFFDLVEDCAEDICLVIRSCSGKIGQIFCALNDCGDALETHSGIDVALR